VLVYVKRLSRPQGHRAAGTIRPIEKCTDLKVFTDSEFTGFSFTDVFSPSFLFFYPYLNTYLPNFVPAHVSIYLSAYVVCQSIHPSIHLPLCLYTSSKLSTVKR
jgi:hypothetical protein